MVLGLYQVIMLSDYPFTSQQMQNIMEHESQHLRNHDPQTAVYAQDLLELQQICSRQDTPQDHTLANQMIADDSRTMKYQEQKENQPGGHYPSDSPNYNYIARADGAYDIAEMQEMGSYIIEHSDGTYSFYMNGEYARISAEGAAELAEDFEVVKE